MKKLLLISTITLTLFSCKTQEQIKREQMIETMSVQMTQGQKLTADSTIRLQSMEERIQEFQGMLEESGHAKNEKLSSNETKITNQEALIKTLTTQIKQQDEKLSSIEKRLSDQDGFIKEILSTLKTSSAPSSKKKLNEYDAAMAEYGKGRYAGAKPMLEALFHNKSYKGAERARIIHNLGMVSYILKKDQDSLTYFSKLYTEFPTSTYNANGLIHLAKTFSRMGQKDQAKQTLEEMLSKFSKHKRAKIAKDLLSKL